MKQRKAKAHADYPPDMVFSFNTPDERVALHERFINDAMSSNQVERFRAITAQGVMNAVERAIDGDDQDWPQQTVGICEGIANSFAALLGAMPPAHQRRLVAVLLVCLGDAVARHPRCARAGPQISRVLKRALGSMEESTALKPRR